MDFGSLGLLIFPKVIRDNAVGFRREGADCLEVPKKMLFAEQYHQFVFVCW